MITEKITSDQEKQLTRFLEDAMRKLDLSKEQAQEIIKNGGKMQAEVRDVLNKYSIADKRFTCVNTFEIVVPANYKHETRLDSFFKENKKKFYYYNNAITDKNFAKATTKLEPGRKFKVKVFQINNIITLTDCTDFLKSQNAVLTGAQGASLVYEQKKEELVKGKWAISFDEKDSLWKDSNGYFRVPYVFARTDGDFEFLLSHFGIAWVEGRCLLCFCD
jgi:hypothetical protein